MKLLVKIHMMVIRKIIHPMGQTDNICLDVYFQTFSQIYCLRGSIFSVVALEL